MAGVRREGDRPVERGEQTAKMLQGSAMAAWGKRGGRMTDNQAVRLGASMMLIELGMTRRATPLVLTDTEKAVSKALARGDDAAKITEQFRLAPERLAYMCVRIIHAHPDA